jgi:hypothetical protein
VAYIGVDPNNGVKPTLFGGVDLRWDMRFRLAYKLIRLSVGVNGLSLAFHMFRLPLPYLPWRSSAGKLYREAYKLSSRFWHNMDGRYGWGSKYRREGQT